ncbi:galanin receptor type 1-like [Arapaima gigas]
MATLVRTFDPYTAAEGRPKAVQTCLSPLCTVTLEGVLIESPTAAGVTSPTGVSHQSRRCETVRKTGSLSELHDHNLGIAEDRLRQGTPEGRRLKAPGPSCPFFARASGTCGDVAFNMISNVAVVADMLAGLVCNSATVWLLTCGKGGLATSDLFLFNSAFSELLICPCIFLALLQHLNVGIGFFLPVLNFCFSFILAARPFFRGCICVDRYLAVVHPIAYLKYRPLKYRLPCLAVVWLIVIGYCILNNFTNSTLVLGLIFMVVLGVDSFCSLSILRVLKRPRPGDAEQEDMNVMKQRAFRTVLVIQATMVMNYVPMLLFTLFKNLLATPDDTCQFFTVAFTLLVLGSFVDPLIYLSRAGKLLCVKRTTEN